MTNPEFTEVIDVKPSSAEIIKAPELEVTLVEASIVDNLAAIDAYVDDQLSIYVGAVIDPNDAQQIRGGRDAMKALNKLKEPIEAERKRIKREYEKPLKAFEDAVKAITGKIDRARADIKRQVDDADQRFKDNRHLLLKEEYEGCVGILADVIPFDAVLDPKWLNRSTAETKAVKEMMDKAIEAKEGYETLLAKELRHKDEVVRKYATTLDMVAALKLEDELNAQDRELAEFKARQEAMAAARAARQAPGPEPDPEPITETAPEPKPEPQPEPAAPTTAPVYSWELHLEFTGPKSLAVELGSQIKALGITGGKIRCIKEVRS